jgi:hypothetical protein
MKIIQYPLPDLGTMEVTKLTAAAPAFSTTLYIENPTGFAVNDFIVVECVGNEKAELRQISAQPAFGEFTVSAMRFEHQVGTCIKFSPFDQSRIYRSTDNITYTLVDTKDLDYQDKYGLITYIDDTGSDDYWYKVEYWNSATTTGIMSSPIKTQTATGFLSVEDFKTETGITGSDQLISVALKYGAENIRRNLCIKQTAEFLTPDTNFVIDIKDLEFADGDLNGTIDKYDFVTWEEAQDGTRTYVTSDITAIDVDRHRITFGSTHPTGSNKLKMEFYLTFYKLTDMPMKLRRLNMLYAVNYIFQNIPMRKLQRGVGSWSLNGVSITFEGSMIRETIADNKKEIAILLKELSKLYTRFTPIHRPSYKGTSWIKSTLHWQSDNVPV